MSRDADLQRQRVELFAEALRDRMASGWAPDFETLVAMIDALPEKQAEAMRMVFVEGIGVREVARRLGRNLKTVQGHIEAGTLNLGARLTAGDRPNAS